MDPRKIKERRKMIERLRPPARLTPGTGPGGIPMANAASSPTEGEEELQEAELFGQEATGEAPVDEAQAEQDALEGAARQSKIKKKPIDEDEEDLSIDGFVPMG